MLDEAIANHGGYVSSCGKELNLLETLQPRLLSKESPLPSTDEVAEGYRFMQAMKSFSIGAIDEALRLLLIDHFTNQKLQSMANEAIAELLLISEIFEHASTEQRQTRYQLMAYFSEYQRTSVPFRFAAISLQNEKSQAVSPKDMRASDIGCLVPDYSERALKAMCDSVVDLIDTSPTSTLSKMPNADSSSTNVVASGNEPTNTARKHDEIETQLPGYKTAILTAITSYNAECTTLTRRMFHRNGIKAVNELQTTINRNSTITDQELNIAVQTVLRNGGERVNYYFSPLILETFTASQRSPLADPKT